MATPLQIKKKPSFIERPEEINKNRAISRFTTLRTPISRMPAIHKPQQEPLQIGPFSTIKRPVEVGGQDPANMKTAENIRGGERVKDTEKKGDEKDWFGDDCCYFCLGESFKGFSEKEVLKFLFLTSKRKFGVIYIKIDFVN